MQSSLTPVGSKNKTKRLLKYGTDKPIELYDAIEEIEKQAMFEILTQEKIHQWAAILRRNLQESAEKHTIRNFHVDWQRNHSSVQFRISTIEDDTQEIREVYFTITT